MKLSFILAFIIFAFTSVPNYALAQNEEKPVDLIGTWEAVKIQNVMWSGGSWDENTVKLSITITEQDGAVFRGVVAYEGADHAPGHDGEGDRTAHSFDVLGVISWKGKNFTMVSHAKDAIVYQGTIINSQTLEVIVYEAGEHAWIARQIFIRKLES